MLVHFQIPQRRNVVVLHICNSNRRNENVSTRDTKWNNQSEVCNWINQTKELCMGSCSQFVLGESNIKLESSFFLGSVVLGLPFDSPVKYVHSEV